MGSGKPSGWLMIEESDISSCIYVHSWPFVDQLELVVARFGMVIMAGSFLEQ